MKPSDERLPDFLMEAIILIAKNGLIDGVSKELQEWWKVEKPVVEALIAIRERKVARGMAENQEKARNEAWRLKWHAKDFMKKAKVMEREAGL